MRVPFSYCLVHLSNSVIVINPKVFLAPVYLYISSWSLWWLERASMKSEHERRASLVNDGSAAWPAEAFKAETNYSDRGGKVEAWATFGWGAACHPSRARISSKLCQTSRCGSPNYAGGKIRLRSNTHKPHERAVAISVKSSVIVVALVVREWAEVSEGKPVCMLEAMTWHRSGKQGSAIDLLSKLLEYVQPWNVPYRQGLIAQQLSQATLP